jgi:hypothetical protein
MIDNRGMVIAHPSNVNILKVRYLEMPGVERLASRMDPAGNRNGAVFLQWSDEGRELRSRRRDVAGASA